MTWKPDSQILSTMEKSFETATREHSSGSELEVMAPRKILRGFVVPVREVPILLKITARMLAFIDIAGEKDMLDRHVEQGIHYHYALAN